MPKTHRTGPRGGYWVSIAGPLLGLLTVLLVGTLKHLLDLFQLVLTDRRQVHITPVKEVRSGRVPTCSHRRKGKAWYGAVRTMR